MSASRQRDRVQEQHKRKHHNELAPDVVVQTLSAPKRGSVVPPFSIRELLLHSQGNTMIATASDRLLGLAVGKP
ncbi:MAG: hypothetical protein ABI927_05675 [Gaiellaceae bacterium]